MELEQIIKTAKQSNIKALQYSFRDRKARKRSFRNLWISRINSGARNLGVSYSVLINSLKNKNILLNRKILSEIAINDKDAFEKIVKLAIS